MVNDCPNRGKGVPGLIAHNYSRVKGEPLQLTLARHDLGIHETPGPACDERIAEMQRTLGRPANDEEAWCSCAMATWMKEAGYDITGITAAARSWEKWGVAVAPRDALPGDVVVFKRPGAEWQGYVAIFMSRNFATAVQRWFYKVIGGNQSNAVSIAEYDMARITAIRRGVK